MELVESYISSALVVLIFIERQHGTVGGLPNQDWSLRVTYVFRRHDSRWWLVYQHADPLVHATSFKQLAARG
jgi:ketosteroid isomerase-like protein